MTISETFKRDECGRCGKKDLGTCYFDSTNCIEYFVCRDCSPDDAERATRAEIDNWLEEKPDRTDEIAAILALTLNA